MMQIEHITEIPKVVFIITMLIALVAVLVKIKAVYLQNEIERQKKKEFDEWSEHRFFLRNLRKNGPASFHLIQS